MSETVRVTLPDTIHQQYEAQAKLRNQPAEWLMAERLRLFAGVNSEKPITIDDTNRQKLEKLFGRNISSPEELVKLIEQAISVRIDDMTIPMTPQLLARLHSRALGVPFEKLLPSLIKRQLEEYVGLR